MTVSEVQNVKSSVTTKAEQFIGYNEFKLLQSAQKASKILFNKKIYNDISYSHMKNVGSIYWTKEGKKNYIKLIERGLI